jgi:hypothetical protein
MATTDDLAKDYGTIRITRDFYFVTIEGHEIPIAKGIGESRLTEEQAIEKARRIREARKGKSS